MKNIQYDENVRRYDLWKHNSLSIRAKTTLLDKRIRFYFVLALLSIDIRL